MNTNTNSAVVETPTLNLVQPIVAPGLIPAPTQAEIEAQEAKVAAEAAVKKSQAIARFDTNVCFKLEAEVIGKATERKVSKSGAVTVSLKGKKELGAISGLKGGDLDAWTRMRRDELKGKQSELAARLAGDNNWSGNSVKMSAKGDKIVLEYVKVAPITVGLRAEPTNAELAQTLGITEAEVVAMKARKVEAMEAASKAEADAKAKAIQDEKDAQELAALEAEELTKSGQGNGEVHAE